MTSENDQLAGSATGAGIQVPPPLVHVIAIVMGGALHVVYPLSLGNAFWWAIVPLILALWLVRLAFKQFSSTPNVAAPNQPIHQLMSQGIFRFTRNPMYLALILMHIGMALLLGSLWILLTLLPVWMWVRFTVIRKEEAYLRALFGDDYDDYCRRVRRWL